MWALVTLLGAYLIRGGGSTTWSHCLTKSGELYSGQSPEQKAARSETGSPRKGGRRRKKKPVFVICPPATGRGEP